MAPELGLSVGGLEPELVKAVARQQPRLRILLPPWDELNCIEGSGQRRGVARRLGQLERLASQVLTAIIRL